MDKLIYNILMALVVTLAGIVARELIPYLKQKRAEVEAKIRHTKWSWAVDIIDAVVRAVEQTVTEDIHGYEKKKLAIEYIERLLDKNGICISESEIDALIEAAVNAMNAGCITVEPVESVLDTTAPAPIEPGSSIAAQLAAKLSENE